MMGKTVSNTTTNILDNMYDWIPVWKDAPYELLTGMRTLSANVVPRKLPISLQKWCATHFIAIFVGEYLMSGINATRISIMIRAWTERQEFIEL